MKKNKQKKSFLLCLLGLFAFSVFLKASIAFAATSGGIAIPSSTGLPDRDFKAVMASLVYWLLAVFGFVAIISFIISGIMYLVAAGDTEQAEKAKKQMYYSIMGVIVGLSGLIIINAVTTWLKGGSKF